MRFQAVAALGLLLLAPLTLSSLIPRQIGAGLCHEHAPDPNVKWVDEIQLHTTRKLLSNYDLEWNAEATTNGLRTSWAMRLNCLNNRLYLGNTVWEGTTRRQFLYRVSLRGGRPDALFWLDADSSCTMTVSFTLNDVTSVTVSRRVYK